MQRTMRRGVYKLDPTRKFGRPPQRRPFCELSLCDGRLYHILRNLHLCTGAEERENIMIAMVVAFVNPATSSVLPTKAR